MSERGGQEGQGVPVPGDLAGGQAPVARVPGCGGLVLMAGPYVLGRGRCR